MEASQLSQQMFLVYMLCKQRNEEDLGIFIPGLSFFGFMHHCAAFTGSAFKAVSRFLGSKEVSTCEVPNDRIFHCLNMPQNSPNLEYTSHLLKNVIIYCRPQFPGLGAIIKKSAFWLLTPIYFVAHSKTLYPHIHWIVLNLEMQAPPVSGFFSHKFAKCLTYFFKLLPGDFIDLHETLHTASVDSPDKKLLK